MTGASRSCRRAPVIGSGWGDWVVFWGSRRISPWPCWRRTAILRGLAVRVALPPFWVLTPGESSSGEQRTRQGITKAGNSHLRRLLVEAAQSIARGRIGYKSKDLKARQRGNTAQVIAYADRANERLRRKYYRMIQRGVKRNVAVTAVARELACFVWGMLTEHLGLRCAGGGGGLPQQGETGGRCLLRMAKRRQGKKRRGTRVVNL